MAELKLIKANQIKLNSLKQLKCLKSAKTIVRGISVKLSDGVSHRFSLTTKDQINIRSLASQGLSEVIYHEDGKACKKYSASDFKLIVEGMQNHINYQTTYFNFLKLYIKSLTSVDDVNKIYYGLELFNKNIPEELKDILRELINV